MTRVKLVFTCLIIQFSLSAQTLPYLEWATYHGGAGDESFRDMAIDVSGNVYVIGTTSGVSGIATAGASQTTNNGGMDVFLAKYSPQGDRIWSTYFGGESDDFGQGIDIDAGGNILVTGKTISVSGIAFGAAFQPVKNSGEDIYIAKFDQNGNKLWATYYGGPGDDRANSIAGDLSGNLVIAGWTTSSANVTTTVYDNTYAGGNSWGGDVLIAKFDSNGQRLWATYYGDTGDDLGLQIDVDNVDNVIVSGWTSSTTNFSSTGTYQPVYGGDTADAFLLKFSPNGNRIWATYYGGAGNDYGDALIIDNSNEIYLAGPTNSSNSLTSTGAHQVTVGGNYDGFLSKFTANGQRIWGTYYGGTGDDNIYGLAIDGAQNVYISGTTSSVNNISTLNAHQTAKSAGEDAYIAKFSGSGSRSWGTYFGGNSQDQGYGLVTTYDGFIYSAGLTRSTFNISTTGADQGNNGGLQDGYLAKFAPCTSPVLHFGNSGYACAPVNYVFDFTFTGVPPYTIYYSIDGIPQTPWITNNNSFYPTVNANQWSDSIKIDSVYNGICKGIIDGTFDFIKVRDSIRATPPIIFCDQATNTYTLVVDMAGGAFGNYESVGPNSGFINAATDRFTSFPIPFDDPYNISFTEAGTFSNCDTVSFSGLSGCNVPCPPSFGTATNNGPVCTGSTLALSADGGISYLWTGPNSFSSNQQNPIINSASVINDGLYTVTVTDMKNCTATQSTTVTIKSLPNVLISSNSPVCVGKNLQLMAMGGSTYQWSGPDGFTQLSQNPVINSSEIKNAGTYIVTVTASNGCTSSNSLNVIVNQLPVAVALSNSPVCPGTSLNLSASGGITYQWSGPNGFTSVQQNPTISSVDLSNAGSHMVTVTDSNGCTLSTSTIVFIHTVATPVVLSNSPVCQDNIINLSVSASSNYMWAGPSGYTSAQQNPSISNSTSQNAGTYNVTTTDSNGCTSTGNTTVIIQNTPLTSISSNSPVCSGNAISLSSSGGISYIWTGPNGFTSTQQNPTISNSVSQFAGLYQLSVIDANGCTGSGSTTIIINPIPNATISSNSPVCSGSSLMLQSSGGTTYQWSGPNGFSSSVQNPLIDNVTPLNSGSYLVTVTDQNLCSAIQTTNVFVSGQLNISISTNSPICEGDELILTSTVDSVLQWSGPAGFSSTLRNPVITKATTLNSGVYVLTVTDQAGCTDSMSTVVVINKIPFAIIMGEDSICKGTSSVLSTPNPGMLKWSTGDTSSSITIQPNSDITYSLEITENGCMDTSTFKITVIEKPDLQLTPNTSIIKGESITLQALGADSFYWQNDAGLSCKTCPDPVAMPQSTTTYCVLGTTLGCSAEKCVTITTEKNCHVILPNVFSPNGDGSNDLWCSLKPECVLLQNVRIFDRWGNLIFTQSGEDVCWDGTANGLQLQNALYVYILEMNTEDQKVLYKTGDILLSR